MEEAKKHNNPFQKLRYDIQKFMEVYKILSPEGKAQFEAQLAGATKNCDESTKKLYYTLLQSAKYGQNIEEAIEKLKKANG